MTRKELLTLNPKEISERLTELASTVSETSIYPDHIKEIMLEKITKLFTDSEIKVRAIDYHNNKASIRFNSIQIVISISTKSTGDTEQVTRLKSKDVKGAGKIAVKEINYITNLRSWFVEDGSPIKLKMDGGINLGGWNNNIELSVKQPICEQLDLENLLTLAQKYENKDIREDIVMIMSQPLIKKIYFERDGFTEKNVKSHLPKELWHVLDGTETDQDRFVAVRKAVDLANPGMVDDEIARMFSGRLQLLEVLK